MNNAMQEVVNYFGGKQVVTAKELGISQPHVSNLVRGVEKVSAELAVTIEKKTEGAFKRSVFKPLLFQ